MRINPVKVKVSESGQDLVEYALILVLVAIVVIAALMILGPLLSPTGPLPGTVVNKFISCPTNQLNVVNQNGKQSVTCNGSKTYNVVVSFQDTVVRLESTDKDYPNLNVGDKYVFTLSQATITQYTSLK